MKPIGAYCLCNVASVNVYDVDDYNDTVLAGINDSEPERCPIVYDNDNPDDSRLGFMLGKLFVPFDEVFRLEW